MVVAKRRKLCEIVLFCCFKRFIYGKMNFFQKKSGSTIAYIKKTPYLCIAKMKRRFRLVARTHASHAWNTGSIPVGATKRIGIFPVLFYL